MLNTMKIQIKKNPKFNVGNHVGISKYKNIFAKGYALMQFVGRMLLVI